MAWEVADILVTQALMVIHGEWNEEEGMGTIHQINKATTAHLSRKFQMLCKAHQHLQGVGASAHDAAAPQHRR